MKNKFLKIAESTDQSQQDIYTIERKKKHLNLINLIVLGLCCFLVEYICIVKTSNKILASLLLIFIILLVVLKALQFKMQITKQFVSQNDLTQEDNSGDLKPKTTLSLFIDKHFVILFSFVVVVIYIFLFEILLRLRGEDGLIIIISFFLTLLSNSQLMCLKDEKIPLAAISILQIYTLVSLQISIQFDLVLFGMNLLYFFFQISQLNTAQTSKKKKMMRQQNQKSKSEMMMCLYQSILSIIPEGIAVLNSDKKLVYANPTLKKILNAKKKQEIQTILLNLGKKSRFEQSANTEDAKDLQKVEENLQKEKKSIDAFSGVSKNREDPTQKHDNLSTNYSEIFKDRKRDTISNPVQMNDKVQYVQEEKQKQQQQPQFQAQCSITFKDQTPKKQIKQKNFTCISETIEFKNGQNICDQQNYNEVAKSRDQKTNIQQKQESQACEENQELREQIIICPQNKKEEERVNEQYQQSTPVIQQNYSHNAIQRNYMLETQKQKTSITHQIIPQSIPLVSDQSEIISYQGLGFNFNDEEQQSISKKVQSCNFIQRIKSNEYSQNKLLQDQYQKRKSLLQCNLHTQNQPLLIQMQQSQIQQAKAKTLLKVLNDQTDLLILNKIFKNKDQTELNQAKESEIPVKVDEQDCENQTFQNKLSINEPPFNKQQKKSILVTENIQQMESKLNNNQNDEPQSDQSRNQSNNQNKQPTSIDKSQPFILKIKQQNLQNRDNSIQLRKTNVSSILDSIFKIQFQERTSHQNGFRQSQAEQDLNYKNDNQSQNDKQNNHNANYSQKQFDKRGSFISHIKKESKEGLTYVQQTESTTKLQVHNPIFCLFYLFIDKFFLYQVNYQEKDLVLQFLSVDILQENSKKDPLVLVMVQDMWQELYEKKVQDLQKEKMKIFASLSHELRTPLNCSISMLEVLKDEMLVTNPQYIEEYLNPALFSNKLLLNQINDILDFVQMDSGKFKYSFQEFSMYNLLKDCQKLVSMQAIMKNIEIKINHEQNVPDIISSDPNRIRQILLNFLSNSLKFTKQGYIELGVKVVDQGILKIYVKDTGIGIKKEDLNTIFSFCSKINYSKKDEGLNTQGCGLGLTISNSIAKGLVQNENIKGGVQVESDYGKGSTFSIIIQDMNDGEEFSVYNVSQNEATKLFIKISSKDMDASRMRQGRSSSITPLLKKRFEHQPQDQIRQIQKKNINQYLTNQQVILEDESFQDINFSSNIEKQQSLNASESENIDISRSFNASKSYLLPIYFPHRHHLGEDSSVVIEMEEDDYTKRFINFERNISIKHHHNRFQEEQEQYSPKNLSLGNINAYKKTPSIQLKQVEKSYDNKSNQLRADFFSNQFNSDMMHSKVAEESKQTSNQSIDLSVNKIFSSISNNLKRFKTTSTSKNEPIEKQSQEQEGFTSYIPCHKLNDLPFFSSRLIISSNKINIPRASATSQIMQLSVSDDKSLNQPSLNLIDPQVIIEQILYNNNIHKQRCNCPQILIVDDNQFNLYALSKTIQQFQFSCQQISDSQVAIQVVKEQFTSNCCKAPKLIFMDIEMPIKNGYEVAIEINEFYKNVQYDQVPIIIACTAYVGQEDHDRAFLAGMRDFINKPILKTAFQQLILNWQDQFL